MINKFIYALFVTILLTSTAHGQDKAAGTCSTFAEATETSTCVVMRQRGVRGVWLTLERSEALRKEHLIFPELQLQLAKTKTELQIVLESESLYKQASEKRAEIQVVLEKQLAESRESESKALDKLNAWYRKPALWLVIGAVLGVAGVISIVH